MNKGVIITLVITAGIIGLFILGNNTREKAVRNFKDTEVACLPNGHQRLVDHIHPELKITVNGENEIIPANIGIDGDCMSEIHTHDETGVVHAESVVIGKIKDFHMGQFFSVWGQSHIREGYNLEIVQDGEIKNSIEDVKFIDHSIIELKYTSK